MKLTRFNSRIELLLCVVAALLAALILRIFFFKTCVVLSGSMLPSLCEKDQILILQKNFLFKIKRNDIVVFNPPRQLNLFADSNPFVKRVKGLPCETVSISNGNVIVSGADYNEKIAIPGCYGINTNFILEKNFFYVVGDNLETSRDSRAFGPIHSGEISGKILMIFYPFKRIKFFI